MVDIWVAMLADRHSQNSGRGEEERERAVKERRVHRKEKRGGQHHDTKQCEVLTPSKQKKRGQRKGR